MYHFCLREICEKKYPYVRPEKSSSITAGGANQHRIEDFFGIKSVKRRETFKNKLFFFHNISTVAVHYGSSVKAFH